MNEILDKFSETFDIANTVSFIGNVWALVPDSWKVTISIAVVVMIIVALGKILIELL